MVGVRYHCSMPLSKGRLVCPRCQGGVFITPSPASVTAKAGLFQTELDSLGESGLCTLHLHRPLQNGSWLECVCGEELVVLPVCMCVLKAPSSFHFKL